MLDGAKRCLRERGFARTTARDVATAAGVSLAAIGYHFGSKEALLGQALIEASGEWVGELQRAVDSKGVTPGQGGERFEAIWSGLLGRFAAERSLWAANFEISPYIEQMPELRRIFADAQQQARLGLVELFFGADAPGEPGAVDALGSFLYALMTGVLAQWLVDPDRAPSARDLASALQSTARTFHTGR